ncbi:MAG: T9SS C-terminal target domain-containing protein [Bacteroidetes bacterium]|nr:MAG: T9SS C-terminal target domain-containing protein [Bacteroidota bacterium]
MKYLIITLMTLFAGIPGLQAQFKPEMRPATPNNSPFKTQKPAPVLPAQPAVPAAQSPAWGGSGFRQFSSLPAPAKPATQNTLWMIKTSEKTGLPIYLRGQVRDLPQTGTQGSRESLEAQSFAFLEAAKAALQIRQPAEEFELTRLQTDPSGEHHLRFRQVFGGVPVYGSEIILHTRDGAPWLLNGRYFPTPENIETTPALPAETAVNIAMEDLGGKEKVKTLTDLERRFVAGEPVEKQLVLYPSETDLAHPTLAWHIRLAPNLTSRWTYFVNAQTGEILKAYSELCKFYHAEHGAHPGTPDVAPPPPTTANATDLLGITRTIDVFDHNGLFYMIDASRSMYSSVKSVFPDEPVGVIWTIDATNTSPANNNFSAQHVTSTNNTWNNPIAVSAHYNGGKAYEYFKNTFNRNSINGLGGNIVSFINVADENGGGMDNAFWNGAAMFYGNGDQAFNAPLAKALDVAGHEMSHGVIQATANLEYFGESGAINESFADVFGAMIDRDDWQMGEDISNPQVFPTGVLRDLSNPHNGGNSLNDPGYQPAHTSEQYTGNQDNGGVHINSGIPNRAYYLFATDIGKAKAEQIYYRALDLYLVKSSQFIDLRLAVIQAATDLHGANSPEVNAAKSAFDAVGIFDGTPNDPTVDVGINPGDDFILMTNRDYNGLWIFTPAGDAIANPLSNIAPQSKPGITDDGSQILYIADDNTMQRITIDWANGTFDQNQIHPDPVWRNVAVAKDGSRIAALTTDFDNLIWVFDFGKSEWQSFELYNPTTANGGITTGDVLYSDVLEFDFTGNWIMYDAFNALNNASGQNIDYWDIGFINVFDHNANNWADGFIFKLFSGLPERTSVGNPTFSKNSDYIIAFDLHDEFEDSYFLMGANIETGDLGTIFQNSDWSYPNYSVDDSRLVFNAEDFLGTPLLAFLNVGNDKISANGNASVYLEEAQWGVWFANGDRALVAASEVATGKPALTAFPNPASETLQVRFETTRPETVLLKMTDMTGRVVRQQQLESHAGTNQQTLALDGLPAGYYALTLQTKEGVASLKILKF